MAFIHQGGDIDGPSSQLQQYMRIKSKLNGFYLTAYVDGSVTYVVNSSRNDSNDAQLWCVQFYGRTFTITCKAQQCVVSKDNELPLSCAQPSSTPPPSTQLWTYDGNYIKTAQSSGYVLDINGGYLSEGAQVILRSFNGGVNQIFTFETVQSYMTVSPGLVLQVDVDNSGDGVICYNKTTSANNDCQLWTLQYDWNASDGTFSILSHWNKSMMSYKSTDMLKQQQIKFGGDSTKWKADGGTICTVDGSYYLSANGSPIVGSQVLLWPKPVSSGTLQLELHIP